MKKLLLDANFLVLPFQHSVDIFTEFERLLGKHKIYTLNRTYNEALDLEDKKYRERVERLVEEKEVEILSVESAKDADHLLLEMAGEYVVCTNDSELRRAIVNRELPVIYLRQENHLEGENLGTALPF